MRGERRIRPCHSPKGIRSFFEKDLGTKIFQHGLVAMESQPIGGDSVTPRSNDEDELFLGDDKNVVSSAAASRNGIHSSSCNSYQIAELVFCLVICIAGLLFELVGLELGHRAIPYQQLSNGEFVVNQMYDQEFRGETIGTMELLIYGIAAPFLLQM
jgi:hypothetical protein